MAQIVWEVKKVPEPIYNGKIVKIANRTIKIGGPRPELKSGEKRIRGTQSICPICYRLLPAVVFERNKKVWIRRVCPEHGEIEEIYWGDAELYYKALKWDILGKGPRYDYVDVKAPCPFTCGLCSMHRSHTALANLVVTNRCDLSCFYCFFYAEKAGYVYEPPLEHIEFMIDQLSKQNITMAIQITGGEPTAREDLVEIVKLLKRKGVKHIQLNTHGIAFSKPGGAKLAQKLREAGVNTVYMSFDGVTPKTNPKNHYEVPLIFDAFRKGGLTSVVLVPTVIKNINDHELGDIIRFAALNMDIVRGVNFQPVSLTGMMSRFEREKYRITIPDTIIRIEEQTDGQINRDAWYPVPCTVVLSRFVEALTGKDQFEMTNHPVCGMGTYVYVERGSDNNIKRFVPLSDFVDIEGFFEYLNEKTEEIKSGRSKYIILSKILINLRKFIDFKKQPKGFNLWKLLYNIIIKRNYEALGDFHYKMLYLGMMHFMDTYNYDVARVMRCDIHYLMPDGRVVPFCTFNVLPDLYRDYVQERYKVPLKEWAMKYGYDKIGEPFKYRRDVKKLKSHPLYQKTYAPFLKGH